MIINFKYIFDESFVDSRIVFNRDIVRYNGLQESNVKNNGCNFFFFFSTKTMCPDIGATPERPIF